ncbi:MAG: hypothetical protein K6B46_00135 [Opitutales bacterium]|nr:hypothetical protein [Opitutales bacterium]
MSSLLAKRDYTYDSLGRVVSRTRARGRFFVVALASWWQV